MRNRERFGTDETVGADVNSPDARPVAGTQALAGEGAAPLDLSFLAPAQTPDEIGRLGHYRVLKVLGKGGMGMVFLAHDPHLDRPVALKIMLPQVAVKTSAKERFLREARSAAKLKSDFIVTIHQVSEERGVPFLAMEYLEGAPLDQFLSDGHVPQILRIGREVARGLADAHARGMIHRDIKPGNIWLDKTHGGRATILDFGLARDQDDVHVTQSGAIVGTPAYMAPEQARGEKGVDARADLFSLGCVLYRLCAGEIPFKGDTTMGVLLAIAMTEPTPPVKINDKIPLALSELIMKLLEKDPANRPASAREVIARLQEIEKAVASLRKDLEHAAQASGTTGGTIELSNIAPAPEPQPGLLTALEQAEAEAKSTPKPSAPPRKRRPVVFALVALMFGGLIALGGIVYYLQTNNGIVRIEINDPDIQVALGEKEMTFKGIDKHDIKIAPGTHGLRIKRGDLEFDTDKFLLRRGETITLKIEWFKEGKLQVVLGDKVIGEKALTMPRPPATPFALQFDKDGAVRVKSLLLPRSASITLETYIQLREEPTGEFVFLGVPVQFALTWRGEVYLRATQEDKKPSNIGITGHLRDRKLENGVFYHVAVVRSPSDQKLFINGKLCARNARSGAPLAGASDDFVIGGGFPAIMREVRVSNSARYDADFTPAQRFEVDAHTLALYHFDEGSGDELKDSSGNGHHGKIVGAKWVKADGAPIGSTPQVDYALHFDGNGHVDLPDLAIDASKPFTLETYVTPDKVDFEDGRACLVNKASVCNLALRKGFWVFNRLNGGTIALAPAEAMVGKRVHVAGVYDGVENRLYVDGKMVRSNQKDAKGKPVPKKKYTLGDLGFIGLLDEMRISKVARYDKDFTPAKRFEPDKDTLALYHFDEGSGDELKDSSSNGHHGKIVGAKWVKADGSPIVPPDYEHLTRGGKWVPVLQNQADFERLLANDFLKPGKEKISPKYSAGTLELNDCSLVIPTEAKDMILRTRVKKISGQHACLRLRNLVAFVNSNDCMGIGASRNTKYVDLTTAVPPQKFEEDFFEFAFSAVGKSLAVYVDGRLVMTAIDPNPRPGTALTYSGFRGESHFRDIEYQILDKASETPSSDYALRFDGNSHVMVPKLPVAIEQPFTLEAWVTPDAGGVKKDAYLINVGPNLVALRVLTSGPTWWFQLPGQSISQGMNKPEPGPMRPVHLAGVSTGKEIRLFIDGKKFVGAPITTAIKAANAPTTNLGSLWVGLINGVRISKTARYDNDFASAKRFESDADTLALYRFDEGAGDVLKDSSGNGHHGKIVGAKWVKADGTPIAAMTPEESAARKAQEDAAAKLKLPLEAENKIGMKLRLIPPGDGVAKAFYLGKYEVTQGGWEQVMSYNPSTFKKGNKLVDGLDTSKFPVEQVGWYDCVEYCNKLSERESLKPYYELVVTKRAKDGKQIDQAEVKILGGNGYHIPTDAEWERGCRAGTKTKYHCGDKDEDLLEYAWFDKNSDGRTHTAGEKKPNAFGLYDMHGNVREWNEEMLTNAASGASECVFRGGNIYAPADLCAVSYRPSLGPATRNSSLGLRLARVADAFSSASIPPFDPAWLRLVAALPAGQQVDALKGFYNHQRLHSSLGYVSPTPYEQRK